MVWDAGGRSVLDTWPKDWPVLKSLIPKGVWYEHASVGSSPSITPATHATIGTGAYPWHHGISGHNVRIGRDVVKAYGLEGHAEPQKYLKSPTLAEAWSEHTSDGAWIGEIGYQIWHLGMIGRGGTLPLGDKPVAIYWNDADAGQWASQNPEMFRMPNGMPSRDSLSSKIQAYFPPDEASTIDKGGVKLCCSPPIVDYQGDVIQAAFENEPIGKSGETSLLYINFKSPDYTGHVVNMLDPDEAAVLTAVDQEIERVRTILANNFNEGEYALIVTADHGQCPLPDRVGGVRLDPIQLENDLNREFGTSVFHLLDYVGAAFQLQAVQQPDLVLFRHLLQQVGQFLVVERGRELVAPAGRHALHGRGEVGRLQFAQADQLVGHRAGPEQLRVFVPRHDRRATVPQAPAVHHGERADLPADPPLLARDDGDVDDGPVLGLLAVQLRSEHLPGPPGEAVEVDGPAAQVRAVDGYLRDRAEVDEDTAPLQRHDQPESARRLGPGGGQEHHVANPADGQAVAVQQRTAPQPGREHLGCGHGLSITSRARADQPHYRFRRPCRRHRHGRDPGAVMPGRRCW
jgi:hypothetical protein